jgi:hypothetical protein
MTDPSAALAVVPAPAPRLEPDAIGAAQDTVIVATRGRTF